MGENINKEFEEYQKQLEIRNKKIRTVIHFEPEEKLDEVIKDLKDKTINL